MKLRKPVLYHQQQYALSKIIYDQYLHCKTLMTTTVIKEMQFAFLVYTCTCRVVLHHVKINKWCGSRKYTYPPQRWSLENPRGRGSQKPNFLRESMKQNWKTKIQDFEVLLANDRQTLNAVRNENDAPDVSCDAFPPMK